MDAMVTSLATKRSIDGRDATLRICFVACGCCHAMCRVVAGLRAEGVHFERLLGRSLSSAHNLPFHMPLDPSRPLFCL
jgi:hypothetical protein